MRLKLAFGINLLISLALAGPSVRTGYFFSSTPESLKDILINQVRLPRNLVENPKFFQQVLNDNTHILNASVVPSNTRIYLEIPYHTQLTPLVQKKIVKVTTKSKKLTKPQDKSWNLSGFYTASFGTYSEQVKGVSAYSNQNSPITVGMALQKNLDETYSLSGSFYYSILESTATNVESQTLKIPPEYGVTVHGNYKSELPFLIYTGFDYESFPTLNTDELIENASLDTRNHQILFLSAGISQVIDIFDKKFFIKAGLSQSLFGQSSRPSTESDEVFTGQKLMLYANSKINQKWSYHLLVKQHFLSGPTELQFFRIGAGIGYNF